MTFEELPIGAMFRFPRGKYPNELHRKTGEHHYDLLPSQQYAELNPMYIGNLGAAVERVTKKSRLEEMKAEAKTLKTRLHQLSKEMMEVEGQEF